MILTLPELIGWVGLKNKTYQQFQLFNPYNSVACERSQEQYAGSILAIFVI